MNLCYCIIIYSTGLMKVVFMESGSFQIYKYDINGSILLLMIFIN